MTSSAQPQTTTPPALHLWYVNINGQRIATITLPTLCILAAWPMVEAAYGTQAVPYYVRPL